MTTAESTVSQPSTARFLDHLRSLKVQLSAEQGQLRITAPKGALTAGLRSELRERKQEVLAFLAAASTAAAAGQPAIPRQPRRADLPLSFAQQRLWILDRLEPGNPFYNSREAWRFRGPVDLGVLARCLNEIVRRHETLRTHFRVKHSAVNHSAERAGQPVQVIEPPFAIPLPVIDLAALAPVRRRDEAERFATTEALMPFDLARGPVLRASVLHLAADETSVILSVHHIASDGWSVGVLQRELTALYKAFQAGRPSPLPALPVQYADFAVWQRGRLQGEVLAEHLSYWERQLRDIAELELPTDRPRPAQRSFRGRHTPFELAAEVARPLSDLGRRHGATAFMTLMAAFMSLLHRITGQDDIVIGSPVANRNRDEIEGLIGFFVNSLVMRGRLRGDLTFTRTLEQTREVALSAYAHQDLPFEKLVEHLQPDRDLSRNPLYQLTFAVQNAPLTHLRMADVAIDFQAHEVRTTRFDLEVHLWESRAALEGVFFYDRDLFDHSTVLRLQKHFEGLLRGLVDDPVRRLSELPLMTPAETGQLLREWNDTAVAYPHRTPIHRLFEQRAALSPTAVALVLQEGELAYGELNARANRLAHRLRRLGVRPEARVALLVERSPEMVIATLAILKAGGAYVPLDPAYPPRRLARMLDDARIGVLLTQASLMEKLPESALAGRTLVDLGDEDLWAGDNSENPDLPTAAGNLAYVMYTSGSTGRPKGIAVTHRSVVRLVHGADYVRFGPDEVLLQLAPISFDAATLEIWGALLHGAQLAIFPPYKPSLEELGAFVQRSRVTLLWLTAGLFHQMVEGPLESLRGVRQLLAGGDVLSPSHVQRALRELPGCRLINGYGPTENTTFTCCHAMRPGPRPSGSVPIGRPIRSTRVHVFDRGLRPLPIGSYGELCTAGDGLARGYLERPRLTAERFVPNPFAERPGQRLYRTGDVVRHLAGGEIEFRGRRDHQVKIRGFRIELAEIEAALEEHPAIRQAALVARGEGQDRRLVACLVTDSDYGLDGSAAEPTPEEGQGEQVARWEMVFDDLYEARVDEPFRADPTFNTVGWQSSYSGEPIPAEEMAEWVEDTVEQILVRRPRRVLEIGCGTGLLLFRIAPHCESYLGTDLSQQALSFLEPHLERLGDNAARVRLRRASADDFRHALPGSCDAVVLNSVVQYFPSADYLVRVLGGAVEAVGREGFVFLGDVRSLPLLTAFHTAAELAGADDAWPLDELRRRVRLGLIQEDELVLDPAFFFALQRHLPRIRRVEVFPKRGRHHNELTQFRYQVVLHIGPEAPAEAEVRWLDWQREQLSLDGLRRLLAQAPPQILGLAGIPNARLERALKARELMDDGDALATVGELRAALDAAEPGAVDPEQVWELGEELSREVALSWAGQAEEGRFDALLRPRAAEQKGVAPGERAVAHALSPESPRSDSRPWHAYASRPLLGRFAGQLAPELRTFLGQRLPEHMVPASYLLMGELPLTANGKLDRTELGRRVRLEPELTRPELGLPFVAPRNEREEVLALLWAEILSGSAPGSIERVGAQDNFFELGGHSLLATQVISKVREVFRVELPLRALFEEPTVAGLARRIDGAARRRSAPPIRRLSGRQEGDVALSFAQQRLWFLDRLMPGNAFYNVPMAWTFHGALDLRALVSSLREIVRRHETLRTRFPERRGQPSQVVSPRPDLPLTWIDLRGLPAADGRLEARRWTAAETLRPFDLARGPVLRITLLRLSDDETALVLVFHHIVADGWSIGVLWRELSVLYGALRARPADGGAAVVSPLPPLAVRYSDFAVWQRRWLRGAVLEEQLDYWRRQLTGAPVLALPTDRPRPAMQSFQGASEPFELAPGLSRALNALSRQRGATLFMTLLAAFKVLLHRHTGQQDVVAGTLIANRNRAEIEGLIGFFVNSLVLRSALRPGLPFEEFLERVKQVALGAYAHQDLPFEQLVEHLQPERDLSRNPIFQVMFALQNAPTAELAMADVAIRPMPFEAHTTRFDLELHLWEGARGIQGAFDYDVDLFDATTLRRLLRHYQNLLEGVVADPDRCLAELPLVTVAEARQLLAEWNDSGAARPAFTHVAELFEVAAGRCPEATAVAFEGGVLSYSELGRRADRLAQELARRGCGADVPVGVALERSAAMVTAVLAVLKAGGAYVPLDPAYPAARLELMVADSGMPLLVTRRRLAVPSGGVDLCYLDDEEAFGASPATRPGRDRHPDQLAYVLYTSGSTGRPKGVALSHRALLNLTAWTSADSVAGRGARTLQFSSLSFDVSFQEMASTWATGGSLVLVDEDTQRDPVALLKVMRENAVERLFIPFVGLQQLAEVAVERGAVPGALKEVLTAGEQLRVTPALTRFFARLPAATLANHYGPTEAHVVTAYRLARRPDGWPALPPIGRPVANTAIFLLDRALAPVPIGAPGELCIGGVGLARGYVGRPGLTAERFVPDPVGSDSGARLYRTGDLARYLAGGDVEFLGRIDHQVKVRGFRVEPGEVEAALAALPQVREAVVAVRSQAGAQALVAYVVPHPGMAQRLAEELRDALLERLPAYMVPGLFVALEALPLTPSGKVDRAALGRRALAASEVAGPGDSAQETPYEEMLAGIWCTVLGIGRVGRDDDFFDLGGHSLLATRVISQVRRAFGVELPIRALFEQPTLAGLAHRVELATRTRPAPPIVPVGRRGGVPCQDVPLSFAQQRLWFLDRLMPDNGFYNFPLAWLFRGDLDVAALIACLREVVRRHEVLRTRFPERDGQPLQVVSPHWQLPVRLVDLGRLAAAERRHAARRLSDAEVRRPFDLARGPVLRATLLRFADDETALVLTFHHIVSDGWSLGVLLRELTALYAARRSGRPSTLAPLAVQYADFAAWQRRWLQGAVLDEQLDYWRRRLAGAPHLELPTDRPRRALQRFRGDSDALRIAPQLCRALDALSRRQGVTLFMTLLAAFQTLLHRHTGQQDVVVGTSIANRNRAEIEGLIGFFVNSLALRCDPRALSAFTEFLERVKEVALGAYTHQDLPFEKLVEHLQPERDLSRNPVFQVMFALQNAPDSELSMAETTLGPMPFEVKNTRFDVEFHLWEDAQGLQVLVYFDVDLFDRTTVLRLERHFAALLRGLVDGPRRRLGELPLTTAGERQQLLREWNDTHLHPARQPARHATVVDLFRAQAVRTPAATAVRRGDAELTYRELDRRSEALAERLRRLGCGPEVLVGLCVERSLRMAVAVLGILKAGSAYVPLDPSYPRARLAFMLEDAAPAVLVTQEHLEPALPEHGVRLVHLGESPDELAGEGCERPAGGPAASHLAYVLYTSGSTGRPKGVGMTHGALANLISWQLPDTPPACVLQFAPLAFDASFQEMFSTWGSGGSLVMVDEETRRDPAALLALMRAMAVERIFVPYVALRQLVDAAAARGESVPSLAQVLTAGEQLQVSRDLADFFARLPNARLHNFYGPTEGHVVTAHALDGPPADWPVLPPIGRPIANSEAFVLDADGRPAPVGVAGELHLAGVCLARGYLERGARTADSFVPHPWSAGPGGRLYRTGDRARSSRDGLLEFLGRADQQVKIRGFRVELGEIEVALEEHPAVREVVLVARPSGGDRGYATLVAYVVAANEQQPAEELRQALRQRLPDYMVPSVFLFLDALPLTPSGKVDRRALPAPSHGRRAPEQAFVAPRNPVEEDVARIWQEVLGLDKVGVHDSFFKLGGHSLLATRVISRLREAFEVEVPLRAMFETPTVAGIAGRVEAVRWTLASAADAGTSDDREELEL